MIFLQSGRFEVDPAHYVSAPQMAWDAMLKKTDVVLYLITDPAMYLMIESGMRGGVCMISKRHAQANNPMVGNNDPEQPLSYIVDWDANNLWVGDVPIPPTESLQMGVAGGMGAHRLAVIAG